MKIASLKTKELSMKYTFYSLDQTGIWHAKKHILIHISHNFEQYSGTQQTPDVRKTFLNGRKTLQTDQKHF